MRSSRPAVSPYDGVRMNATEKLNALRRCDTVAMADEDALQWLAERAETEYFEPGQVVFDSGDSSAWVYIVASGKLEARLSADSPLVSFFEPGALFGEYSMFVGGSRTACVVATGECILLAIDDESFRQFLLRSPEAMLQLLRTAVRRRHRAARTRD